MNESTLSILIEEIGANPYQVRETEDPIAVQELAANIEKNGLLQPPTVRLVLDPGMRLMVGDHHRYEIAFGHTRLAAFKLLTNQGKVEYSEIPCFVRELDELQMFEMAVAENIKRRDLNPIERARAMQTYINNFHKTSAETGEFFNCDESTVRGAVRLLGLPELAQEKVSTGEISVGNARKLLTLQRVAPDEVDAVINDLPTAIDPDEVIADALRESDGVLSMGRSYDDEAHAGDGLWPLNTPASTFTRLPELRAAEAAKSLGWEFNSSNRPLLEQYINALQSPLADAAVGNLIKDGADADVIEHLAHLVHPPACTACAFMARSGNNYYCGMKACHERKKKSWLATEVERLSRELGIAVYDPKADGKDVLVPNSYDDNAKKLFEKRDADLRLKAAPRGYSHAFTNSCTVQVVLTGKRAEKVKEKEREQRAAQPSREDYNAEHAKHQAAEKKVMAFLWNQAVPAFLPLLAGVECLPLLEMLDDEIFYTDIPDDAIPAKTAKTKTKVDYLRRRILHAAITQQLNTIDYEDKEQPATIVAEHLKGVARTWGVTLPKDWLKKAAEEDAVSEETKE